MAWRYHISLVQSSKLKNEWLSLIIIALFVPSVQNSSVTILIMTVPQDYVGRYLSINVYTIMTLAQLI